MAGNVLVSGSGYTVTGQLHGRTTRPCYTVEKNAQKRHPYNPAVFPGRVVWLCESRYSFIVTLSY